MKTIYDIDRENRAVIDRIKVEQRKLSPRFPDVATALERRRVRREHLVARVILLCAGLLGFCGAVSDHPRAAWSAAGACVAAFVVVCFNAGSRHDRR